MMPQLQRDSSESMLALMSRAARAAAEVILSAYHQADHGVVAKGDDSPLTRADIAAHRTIAAVLAEPDNALPLVSEEGDTTPWAQRRHWRRYWLVDPLDGTREFIRRNDQFTVNIALIEDGVAVLGVVLAPVQGVIYLGRRDSPDPRQWRAWKQSPRRELRLIRTRPLGVVSHAEPLTLMTSRRYSQEHTDQLIAQLSAELGPVVRHNLGSSLKMCLIAEGVADLYPRFGPTGEWDTAAGQAIIEAAGGCLCGLDGQPRRYNQRASLLNPSFFAAGDPTLNWPRHLARWAAALTS